MINSRRFVIFAAVACLLVCVGEFAFMFILGAQYPGYSQLKDTMSSLGASMSPVSDEISTWWVIMGVLFIIYGAGVKKAFSDKGRYAGIAAWLIMLYGIGEGLGSGLFKANRIVDGLSASAVIHDILGGIGVIAILLLPLIMQKVISKKEVSFFHGMSRVVFICGIGMIILFLFRYSPDENNFFSVYKGIWQRLFMLNTYIYLATIAILMLRKVFRRE